MGKVTQDRLREAMFYDPETGVAMWLISPHSRVRAGDRVGTLTKSGYISAGIDGRKYRLHVLIWVWMTGRYPEPFVDHRDLDKSNNRWLNLREATKSQNHANKPKTTRNTSGLKGVSWNKQKKRWIAQTHKGGKHIHLGYFDCKAAAHFAFIVGADKAHGEFARFC